MSKLESNDCPQPEMLSDFLLGKLDPKSSQQCESHLAQCDPCVETISGLNLNDTFQSLVANSDVAGCVSGPESLADQSVISNLIHRLAAVGTKTSIVQQSADQRAADVVALLSQSDSPDAIGQIDHYRIENVLGCGSTGVVFGATDENLDRPVAIKVLRPSLGDAARQRFIAEARATANLNHPNIVTIFHVGETGSVAYIVMQWLPGETLEQKLERESLLDSSTVKNYGIQIARGLTTAHDKCLIHRDIKPANLWITEDGHVKILDFGLVRIMDESPQLTCTGMIAGTPCYMSPEQSRGDDLDVRSDLFSLGCVLYRCLAGKLPFVSANALATLQAIQRVAPEAPKSLEPSVDQDLSDLVMSLLEKSPHRRPGSANDVAVAIESPRSEWPFQFTPNDDRRAAEPQKLELTPATSDGMDSFWGRALAAIALGMIGFAAFAFWPQIIRIATNQGEIVIESNDPDVQIEVLKGGEQVEIVDLKTDQSIQIQSGSYQIRALGDANSISIDKETLTLSRGETEIVTVKKHSKANTDKNARIAVDSASNVAYLSADVDLELNVQDVKGSLPTNQEFRYKINIENRGSDAASEVELLAQFSDGIEPTKAKGVKSKIAPGQVIFAPISKIDPGQAVSLDVAAVGIKRGVHNFRIVLSCGESSLPKVIEGTTQFHEARDVLPGTFAESEKLWPRQATGKQPTSLNPMHRVGPGDVLGIFVEEVTGTIEGFNKSERDYLGIPVAVRSDGTISLPLVSPINVRSMTALDIENMIRKTYSEAEIFTEGRSFHVSVVVVSDFEGTIEAAETAAVADRSGQQSAVPSTFDIQKDNPQFPNLNGPVRVVVNETDGRFTFIGDAEDCTTVQSTIDKLLAQRTPTTNFGELLASVINTENRTTKTVYREPVYDGMTFNECLNAVRYERDGQKLEKPCVGLMELKEAEHSPELNDVLLQAILRIQRINYHSPAAQRFARWLSSSQLQKLALDITANEDEARWTFFNFQFVNQWKRLRPIEDKLISNIIAAMKKDSVAEEYPASILASIIREQQLSSSNTKKAFEALSEYAPTAENSNYYFRTMISSNPSWPTLGKDMCEPISRCNSENIAEWTHRVSELSDKNKRAVIKAFATRIFELEYHNVSSNFLRGLSEDLYQEIKPIHEKFVEAKSESAIDLLQIRIRRQEQKNQVVRPIESVEGATEIEKD